MKERVKVFFITLLICAILGVAIGYVLTSYIFEENNILFYVLPFAILFFAYFRIVTILETPEVLFYPVYGYGVLFSSLFLLGPFAEALYLAAFVILGPFEYLFKFRVPMVNPWG